MRVIEKSKQDIEERFSQMGDYVKMDYLLNCLKNSLDFDTRKFVLVKLSGLYEERRMYADSGRMMLSAAEINTTFQNKINDFVKSTELFIKSGDYNAAESTMRKATVLASVKQKEEIVKRIKESYKTQAYFFLKQGKRNNAIRVYERLLVFDLSDEEESEARNKLLELYESLGMIKEYNKMKRSIQ